MRPLDPTDLLVFVALMALLGSVMKVALVLLQRRRAVPNELTATLDEVVQRLARVEQGVEDTALEIERLAEGQRFTARVLAERSQEHLPGSRAPGLVAERARTVTPT